LFEPTGSRRDAASVIFNLPGYRVVDAVDLPLRGRRVKLQPVDLADGCPSWGVISSRVHAWAVQRVRDIPYAGQLEVVVRKPRLVCAEPECPRGRFTPGTEQLPVRGRCTTRVKMALLSAVIDSGRAVAEVAADHGWPGGRYRPPSTRPRYCCPTSTTCLSAGWGFMSTVTVGFAGSATQMAVAGGESSRG
jgi:transposase